jgi:hypothetical protein
MGTLSGGPNIVTDGLVFNVDAANVKSYPGSGTTWRDLSRSGNNGTLTNGPTFNAGNGGSIVFDGVDDRFDTNISILKGLQTFTINVWFYTATLKGVLLSEGASSNVGIQFWLGSGTNGTTLQFGDGTNNSFFNSRITLQQNIWVNLCFTVANKTGYSYLNSIFQSSYINASDIFWPGTTGTFKLASRENNTVNSDCRISNVSIYNRALSAQEILQNYNATKTRFGL